MFKWMDWINYYLDGLLIKLFGWDDLMLIKWNRIQEHKRLKGGK